MPKARLSDKMIAGLAVEKPTRFWDTEMPNLVLVALPTGTATFYVYYSLHRSQVLAAHRRREVGPHRVRAADRAQDAPRRPTER
jgi:hypothetical protein